jgi:Flp pilus assembly protein TadD
MGHPLSIWHVWGRRLGPTFLGGLPLGRIPLVLLVIVLGTVTNSQAQTMGAYRFLDEGNALLAKGEYDKAEGKFRKALCSYPDFMAARNNLGVVLHMQWRFDEALSEFNQVAASSGPHQAGGQLNVGVTTAMKGNLDDAVDKAEAAVKLRADYAEAYFNIGWIQDERGKLAEAETAYRNAIQQKPMYTSAELGLAIVLAKRQQFDEALETITAVLGRDSLSPGDRALAEKNRFAARVFAELANPSPEDQAEITARRGPALGWGAKLRNEYPAPQLSFAVRLVRKGDDLSRQPEVPADGHKYRPTPEMASGTYSWQIVASAEDNQVAYGPVYSFTYHRNLPPSVPQKPIKLPVKENAPAQITLTASDPEDDPLTFRVVKAPSKGTLAGTAPNLVYQPGDGSLGEDEFSYVANDGYGDSLPAIVQCLVTPDLRANNQQIALRSGVPKEIVLTSANPSGRSLVYSVTSPPAHGKLTGDPPTFTYTPASDFAGEDQVGFIVAWHNYTSEPGWVTLTVKPNSRPVAAGQHLEVSQYGRVNIQLSASDADQDPLQYRIVRRPESGELTGQSNAFCYSPSHDYIGRDSFQFVANDGFEDSEPATVEIGVVPWFSAHPFLPIAAVVVGAIWYMCLCGCLLDRRRAPECLLSVGLLLALVVGTWLESARTIPTASLLGAHGVALLLLTARARLAASSSTRKRAAVAATKPSKNGTQSKTGHCSCPACGATVTIAAGLEKSPLRCPKCGGAFVPRSRPDPSQQVRQDVGEPWA